MALDKAIESGKEHRKPYKGSKAVDKTCRNHGSCSYCRNNRLYSRRKSEERQQDAVAAASESLARTPTTKSNRRQRDVDT